MLPSLFRVPFSALYLLLLGKNARPIAFVGIIIETMLSKVDLKVKKFARIIRKSNVSKYQLSRCQLFSIIGVWAPARIRDENLFELLLLNVERARTFPLRWKLSLILIYFQIKIVLILYKKSCIKTNNMLFNLLMTVGKLVQKSRQKFVYKIIWSPSRNN